MGYSPPKGRSPTCYSPVRHSHEHPKVLIPVRLACLIRAASVRSEPGSNSPSYSVASYSEEQKAQFSYTLLFITVRSPASISPLSILTSSLIFPSLLQKNTPSLLLPLTAGFPKPTRSLPRCVPFSLFKDLFHPPLRSPPRGAEAQDRIYSTQTTNVKY
jgi:hypothetical protein